MRLRKRLSARRNSPAWPTSWGSSSSRHIPSMSTPMRFPPGAGHRPLHRPLRSRLQQLLELLLVEFCVAGGAMAAGLLARRDKEELAVLELLHGALRQAGFGRVALVVGGVDHEHRRLNLVEPGRGIVIGG